MSEFHETNRNNLFSRNFWNFLKFSWNSDKFSSKSFQKTTKLPQNYKKFLNFAKFSKICNKQFTKFAEIYLKIRAVQRNAHLVDLEKCWKMNIYLQRSASIQPRTGLRKYKYKVSKILLLLIASPEELFRQESGRRYRRHCTKVHWSRETFEARLYQR